MQAVWDTVAGVTVEAARASVASDRAQLLELVRRGPGAARVNKKVVERVQQWFPKLDRTPS